MSLLKLLSGLIATILFSTLSWSSGIGISSYPLMIDKKYVSLEMTGVLSSEGGFGVQGRYTQKLHSKMTLDAGLGISGGKRSGRIFAGLDYEFFPDYMKQPRFSVKALIQNVKEGMNRKNMFGITPVFSKGFSFWGIEGFPYASIPLAISLNGSEKSYETIANLSVGLTGKIPFQGYRHLTANLEGMLNIKDSYSGLFCGLAFPMN
tara:strand:+ start:3106 stop:3723 length:618 start_codon:yes stop_codon:yes gene_type:complete